MIIPRSQPLPEFDLPLPPTGEQRLYAIAFDLGVDQLRTHYSSTSPNNAYAEVRAILEANGFAWRQGSVYFGDPARVNAVSCVLTVQRLAAELPWFARCVRDPDAPDRRKQRSQSGNHILKTPNWVGGPGA